MHRTARRSVAADGNRLAAARDPDMDVAAFAQEGRGRDFACHALGGEANMFGPDGDQDVVVGFEVSL